MGGALGPIAWKAHLELASVGVMQLGLAPIDWVVYGCTCLHANMYGF